MEKKKKKRKKDSISIMYDKNNKLSFDFYLINDIRVTK